MFNPKYTKVTIICEFRGLSMQITRLGRPFLRIIIFVILAAPVFTSAGLVTPNNNTYVRDGQITHIPNNFKNLISPTQNEEPFYLKVLTYNLLQAGVYTEWRDAVVEENPDIALFQEAGGDVAQFDDSIDYINQTLIANGKSGYPYWDFAREPLSTTGGAVIISKFPIVEFYQLDELPLLNNSIRTLHHDLLHGVVNVNDTEIHFLSNHFACCGFETSIEFNQLDMEATLKYIDSFGPVPVIFGGDLNSVSPADVGLMPELDFNLGFEPLNMLLDTNHPKAAKNHTWVDVYRELNPQDPGATFVSDQFFSRIDYIIANQFFFDKLVNSTTADTPNGLFNVGSDHGTLDATFNLNPNVDVRPPHKVYGVSVDIENENSAVIVWDAVADEDIDHYSLFRNGILIDDFTPDNRTFIDDTVQADLVYEYEVSATDVNGNTGYKSDKISFDLSYGQYGLPEAPIITGEITDSGNVISWSIEDTGGYDIIEFKVYRSVDGGNEYFLKQRTSDNSWLDTSLRPGTSYFYKVTAVNSLGEVIDRFGEGPDSNIIILTIPDPTTSDDSSEDDSNLGISFVLFTFTALIIAKKYKK